MPAKKPDDMPKPDEPTNPATSAHRGPAPKDMDPDLEAKRSGPPPGARDSMPKPLAPLDEPETAPPAASDDASPAMSPADVEAKLKDPAFDPEGHERLRMAEESRSHPSGPNPVTSDVDEHGNPMEPKR